MATVVSLGATWNTTAGNKTVVATPTLNDLIVVVHGMSGWASGDTSVVTDNNSDGLGTYTQIEANPLSTGGGTAGALWISVRNALIGSATSTTFTVTNSGDTGGGLTVLRVTGMVRVGANAVRQSMGESTQTENPPVLTFGGATLSINAIILAVFGEDNPAGVTAPTDFTEHTDTGWASPTSGIEVCSINSGKTASTYSWSGGALTDHNEVGVELDTTVPVVPSWDATHSARSHVSDLHRVHYLSRSFGHQSLSRTTAQALRGLLAASATFAVASSVALTAVPPPPIQLEGRSSAYATGRSHMVVVRGLVGQASAYAPSRAALGTLRAVAGVSASYDISRASATNAPIVNLEARSAAYSLTRTTVLMGRGLVGQSASLTADRIEISTLRALAGRSVGTSASRVAVNIGVFQPVAILPSRSATHSTSRATDLHRVHYLRRDTSYSVSRSTLSLLIGQAIPGGRSVTISTGRAVIHKYAHLSETYSYWLSRAQLNLVSLQAIQGRSVSLSTSRVAMQLLRPLSGGTAATLSISRAIVGVVRENLRGHSAIYSISRTPVQLGIAGIAGRDLALLVSRVVLSTAKLPQLQGTVRTGSLSTVLLSGTWALRGASSAHSASRSQVQVARGLLGSEISILASQGALSVARLRFLEGRSSAYHPTRAVVVIGGIVFLELPGQSASYSVGTAEVRVSMAVRVEMSSLVRYLTDDRSSNTLRMVDLSHARLHSLAETGGP